MKAIKKLILVLVLICCNLLYAQSSSKIEKQGKVTHKSSKSIYIKFENTKGIKSGDILYSKLKGKFTPIIKAKYISKKSVAGELLKNDNIKIGDFIYALIPIEKKEVKLIAKKETVETKHKTKWKKYEEKPRRKKVVNPYKQNLSGRLTINSSSNFSNYGTGFDYQRWRYSLNLSAKNIGGSRLSLLNYSTFTFRSDEWANIKNNLSKALRIYDLSLKYRISDNTNIWFGRHLNRTISNISAIDGVQLEHKFSAFSLGVVAGYRPDFIDMSINSNLLEYGVYLTKQNLAGDGLMTNTLAFFQQNNNSKTDRRFFYFQHSNNLIKGVNFFFSSEVDLYKKEMGVGKNSVSLTSLYLSTNIRPSRFISFSISYDARKDVIYYETFRTFLDSVINNETRQGFRIRTTIHPFKKITLGSHFGYRYRKGDNKPNRNYGGFISYSQIPILEVHPTFSYNRILSSFIDGSYWGVRLSRRLFPSSVYLTLGYKKTDYSFSNGANKVSQENVSAGLSTRLFNSIYMSLNYEGIFEGNQSTGHVYVTLSTRF